MPIVNSQGEAIRTRRSALLLHGLYNSPLEMKEIADFFHSKNMNVVNSRLDGHYEADNSALKYRVEWQTWLNGARKDLTLARELGDKVILVGHSTGALVHTWLAIENPDAVAGLVLFSPAFKVQTQTELGAKTLAALDKSFTLANNRLIAGRAGVEVSKMARAFANWLLENRKDGSYASRQLAHVPIWMANTQLDVIISTQAAENFLRSSSQNGVDKNLRFSYKISLKDRVLHDAIVSSKNPKFAELLNSIEVFFDLETQNL